MRVMIIRDTVHMENTLILFSTFYVKWEKKPNKFHVTVVLNSEHTVIAGYEEMTLKNTVVF